MRASGISLSRWGSRFILTGLLLLVLSPFAYVAGRSILALDDPSPALGRAQVITQGISVLPAGEAVWPVVRRTAPALGDAKVGRRVTSFVLATDEPILITEALDDGTFEDVARLAPGESYLTKNGTRQIRASLSAESTQYLAIELVPAERAEQIGNGDLLFVSDPFTSPTGQHDLDLIRNVLTSGDVARVPDTGGEIMILATDGAIDILSGGSRRLAITVGESAVFSAEELEIRPAESLTGAPTDQLASLTSMLQADQPTAAYVVAVIGPEVPKTGETPSPIETSDATDTPASTIPNTPTNTVETPGSIGALGRLCSPGVTIETVSDRACPAVGDGFDMALTSEQIALTINNASPANGIWTWSGLPLDAYSLVTTRYPGKANDYFIPGSAAVGGSAASGYTVTIDNTSSAIVLNVYFLQPAERQTTSSTTITISICQWSGTAPTNCLSPAEAQVDPQPYLVSDDGRTTVSWAEAAISGGSYTWALPAGTWYLYQEGWPYGYVVDGKSYSGSAPYVFTVDGANPVSFDVQDVYPVVE